MNFRHFFLRFIFLANICKWVTNIQVLYLSFVELRSMKIGVVTFPGSNCNMDMVHALTNDLGYKVVELWHKDSDLQNVDAVVLPGGFSYGHYLRSGAIARFSMIMEEVVKFANNRLCLRAF